MPRVDPTVWRRLEKHLEEVLDTPSGERATWLASLRASDAALADEIERMLAEHSRLEAGGFLERGPQLTAATASAQLGAFRLVEAIGQGGMGTVWLAERSDGHFESRVAIKVLNPAVVGRTAEDRLRREARILGALNHPNVARLLDAGVTVSGQPYLVLEHVEGRHIDDHCAEARLGIEARVQLFLDLLAAVSFAHASLIVHRDIKPSNVLVTHSGQVKLLDFGIAKLLDPDSAMGAATLSHEAGSPLTPAFAAPEQITGAAITTVTDVYALGVLLYLLLAGRHPVGQARSAMELLQAIVETEPPRMSDVATEPAARRALRGDLDRIVAKALGKRPAERYASVEAFAEDLRRYLRYEPIRARPDAVLYRAGKFVRRNRIWLFGVIAIVVSLATGLGVAIHQRELAQRRFFEVRRLASKLFDIDAEIRKLPGASKSRQLIVDTSLEYLRRLELDAGDDLALALEVGTAYMRVGRVQGVPISTNLGQLGPADRNLSIAEQYVARVLAERPADRTAILRAGQIAHDRMILAGLVDKNARALELAGISARWLDRYLESGEIEPAEADQVLLAYLNVANRYRLAADSDRALEMLHRMIALANANARPLQAAAAGLTLSQIMRDQGSLEEAVAVLHDTQAVLAGSREQSVRMRFTVAQAYEAKVLGDDIGPNLGRVDEAIALFERAYATVRELARQDPTDAIPRRTMKTAGYALARLLRESDPGRALALCDEILAEYAHGPKNVDTERDSVQLLAISAAPLQRLGRAVEARARLDDAFERLLRAELYPADTIELGSAPADALSELADLHARTGELERAIALYRELLQKGLAAQPRVDSSLNDAAKLSRVYESLSALYRRAGQGEAATPLEGARHRLWWEWSVRLPSNVYVSSQLSLAGTE